MSQLMTKLEAVNRILAATGDEPVNSLLSNYPQVEVVVGTLDDVTRRVQTETWWFNEDESVELLPNQNDQQVYLPINAITAISSSPNYVQRGNRMYDRVNRTYIIGASVVVDLVMSLDFEELPQSAREYIVALSRYQYNTEYLGDDSIKGDLEREVLITETRLRKDDVDQRGLNIFNSQKVTNIAYKNRRRG